jgi:tRNA uridine 5-carboxymethylaminomethyl modification enzyme
MVALARLLQYTKLDREKIERAGYGELTATAGLTWAQLLKRPEVSIEPILAALRDDLVTNPLLAEFVGAKGLPEGGRDHSPGRSGAKSWVGEPILDEPSRRTGTKSVESEPSISRSTLRNEARAVETEIKFVGYLDQQKKSIEKLKAAEAVAIPEWIEYGVISGLSREMRETLERVRPITIGQASRIPGVTPAALSLVHVAIRIQGQKREPRLERAAG